MERQSGKEKLAIQIGIGLIAGTFSIIPVASGAPVLDKVVSGGATVNAGTTTTVTSTTQNNVIDWQDFSVAQGEKVQFDGGAKTNNYLNLVTGPSASQINGAIEGGANVYLVNPHGVIFGKTASVDVGNFYASTRDIGKVDPTADLTNPGAVLASSGTSSAAGDIVNLGKIQADAVIAEGKNITFLNTANVTNLSGAVNRNVMLTSNQGTIRVGEQAAAAVKSRDQYQMAGGTVENYSLITNQAELQGMSSKGKYYLGNDIICSGTYTPVGTVADSFQGVFDGQYFTVANINVSGQDYGGLFGYVSGAAIQNVGVVNASVSANFAGGVVGYAKGSKLTNVYNAGGTITGAKFQGGGIVGGADNTTIDSAYNTGSVLNRGGGIAGEVFSNVKIQNAYNTASLNSGIFAKCPYGMDSVSIADVYTVGKATIDTSISLPMAIEWVSFTDDTYKKSSRYSGWDISNVGGANTVWRIYEGQSLPLLRAFLTANGTVTANFDYKQGTKTGSNNGADVKSVYNAQYLTLDKDSVAYGASIDTSRVYTDLSGGIRNVNDGTKALLWSGQNGYDLVGTNATITARPVTVATDLKTVSSLTKEYDGTTDATAAIKNLYYGTENSDKGILEADSSDTRIGFTGSATYESRNVGTNNKVTVAGTVTIEGNANGNYALYNSDGTAANAGSIALNGTVANSSITQKALVVSFAAGKGTGIDKTYDGTTAVLAADAPSDSTFALAGGIESHSSTDASGNPTTTQDVVSFEHDKAANYTSKDAGDYTNKVGYGGLKLTGADANNYILKDAAGNVLYGVMTNGVGSDVNTATGGTLYGSGKIDPKALAATGFSWYTNIKDATTKQTATREYDATSNYAAPVTHEVRSDNMANDDLAFTVTAADFITAADGKSKTTTKNVMDAGGVLYQISVSGADAKNYSIDGKALLSGGTAEVFGAGSITPRTINLAVAGGQAVKTYDGDAAVKVNGDKEFSLATGYVTYADAKDTAHQLIVGDDNKIVITGQYLSTNGEDAQDVNASGTSVLAKQVDYTAKVVDKENAASANYTLVMGPKSGTTLTGISGTGIINQKVLTGITFGDVSKTYDTKTGVLGDQPTDKAAITGLTGLVSGDSAAEVISTANIVGNYGTRSGSTFTASADVLRDASNNATSKDVQYTGISHSLTGAKAHNYTLGTLSDTQYGKGTINPLTINSSDQLTLDRTALPITKVYDGKSDVAHGAVTANGYIDKLYATVGATKVYFDYTVNTAVYATKNSQTSRPQNVTYKLDVTKGNGNFEIANTALTNGLLQKTFTKAGVITPKDLTVTTIVNNNVTKTYDATKDVVDAAGKQMTGNSLVTVDGLISGDGATNATTAEYDSPNAGSRTVDYALKVSGGEDDSNYRFVNNLGIASTTASGNGTINKRELTVTVNKPQTKVYDGNVNLVSPLTADDFTLNDGTTGNSVLSKDKTVLDVTKVSGQYGTGNTADSFQATPNVSEVKNVGYTGIQNALGAAAQDNYQISDKAYGSGSITPASIGANAFHFTIDGVARDYDATTHVGTSAGGFVTGHYVTLAPGKNADFGYFINSAEYTTNGTAAAVKDAGIDKKVVYTITIDPVSFANYKLDSSVTPQMQFESDTGVINKKAVYASVVSDNLTKTYDGSEELRNGNPTWSGDTSTGTKLAGDAIIKLDGLVDGDNATNASTGSYVGAGVGNGNKSINYAVAIDSTHAGNYVIYDAKDKTAATKTPLSTLTTAKNTINPYGLAVSFGPVNRDYDGTTAINSTLVKPTLAGGLKGDVVGLAAGYTANYIDPNVKTVNASSENAVIYKGLKLDSTNGADLANYTLVNSSGMALTATSGMPGTQTMTGAGTMNKFKLTGDNVTFTFNPISKEYDATNVVKYNGETTSEALRNYLNDHYVTLAGGAKQDIVVDMDSAIYGDDNDLNDVNHGTGKTVTFKMSLNGDNYDFSDLQAHGVVNPEGKFKAQTTNGNITTRKVYASLMDNPADTTIVKTYDGTNNVLQDTTGKVIFREGDLLTSLDHVKLDTEQIKAHYDDVHGNAGADKDVYYDVKLNGDTAGNYEIHDLKNKNTANDTQISTLTGKGTINKKELTVSFDRQEKEYDGNADIKVISPINLSGLVSGENLTLDTGKIKGQYGTLDPSTNVFTADQNVSRDATGNVTDKGVRYTGIGAALGDALPTGGALASNYTIADTLYFNEAAAKGRIKPLAITQQAVADWTSIAKEYDATKAVPKDQQTKALKLSVMAPVDHSSISLDYTVDQDEAKTHFDDKNVGAGHTLTFTISAVNQNLGNYQLSDGAAAYVRNTTWTSKADNRITPRHINASLTNSTDVTKIYDGTKAAAAANLVVAADDASMLKDDGVQTIITAVYDDKNATIDPGAAHTNRRKVTYTLGLRDDNPNPNYVIDQSTYTASGDISRREVYVDFTKGSNTGMDKVYDGFSSVADSYRDRIGLVAADSTSGVVDDHIELLADSISAAYESPHVKRDFSTGKVTTQEVSFTNFNLADTNLVDGNDAGNYVVKTLAGTSTLKGKGTITPQTINVSVKDGPVKEYDGETAVTGDAYTTAANINVDYTNLVAGDTINVGLGAAPRYNDANAGQQVGYTYDLNWDNGDYELAVDSKAAGQQTLSAGVEKKELTAAITGRNGIITPRVLTVDTVRTADKVYDGSSGVENAAANIVLSNRIISGDTIGLTVAANYNDVNASGSEDSDTPLLHTVDYTLTLANGNYQLSKDTAQGQGTIRRKGLEVVAEPVAVDTGVAMPSFQGRVKGLVAADSLLANGVTFGPDAKTTTDVPGSYAVYGWYSGRTSGNLGRNYTFSQAPANETALTVRLTRPDRGYFDTINPKAQFTPDGTAYRQSSEDQISGFNGQPDAALEYRDGNGGVMGAKDGLFSTDHAISSLSDRPARLGQIGVSAGNVVNLSSASVANAASIEVDSSGTVVNLEIVPVTAHSSDREASAAIESAM